MSILNHHIPEIQLVIEQVKNHIDRILNKEDKGWIINAFYVALISYKLCSDGINFPTILNWVIKKGGDTDTNGCICGNIIGFYFGLENILSDLVTKENYEILLNVDCNAGDYPINPIYSLSSGLYLLKETLGK